MGGKVQAMPGFADHVGLPQAGSCARVRREDLHRDVLRPGDHPGRRAAALVFEREKCVHCGACLWNCAQTPNGECSNIEFRAGAGGLHSAEN